MAKSKTKTPAPASAPVLANPFKPGAGHSPPCLAGREKETEEFNQFLGQETIIQNVVLTGLRGVGKTVLMDDVYRPMALGDGWVWVGSDFSESAFVDEASLCNRILTDLAVFTSTLEIVGSEPSSMGINSGPPAQIVLDHVFLVDHFNAQPGLNSDKLKSTLEIAWHAVKSVGKKGIVFAYDESQVVQDRKNKDQFPLALLLETFQSLQRKGMTIMLLLTGLPTLFPRLVESRTYAERMFKIQEIGRLDEVASRRAILEPLKGNEIQLTPPSVELIISETCGYPYFIQFICREAFDYFKAYHGLNSTPLSIPIKTLIRKLDGDFFSGRWSKVPDRQRELMLCIASLENARDEFTVNQITDISAKVAGKHGIKPFKTGDVSSMVPKLISAGVLYKNRHGKYLLAVPLLDAFILRQFEPSLPTVQGSLFD